MDIINSAPPPIPNDIPLTAPPPKASEPVQEARTLDMIYKIDPMFKTKYVQDIKGKEFVKYAGLLILAKAKGIKSLTTKIVQFPGKDNNYTAIVEAMLVGWDKDLHGNIVEVSYSDIGDANELSCNKGVALHYVRVAATRAKGRCIRDFVGIDAVMDEELIDFDTSPGASSVIKQTDKIPMPPMSVGQPDSSPDQQQISTVNTLITQLGWTGETFQAFIDKLFPQLGNQSNMNSLQANFLIEQMKLQTGV